MANDSSLTYELVVPLSLWQQLHAHLFSGDHDEHGAVIAAGVASNGQRVRLLARHLILAKDGVDYVSGQRGYRMLTADFVRDQALLCRDEQLAYLAVHNHGGRDIVQFSSDDLQSHERGYPALRDITRGQIVGAIVIAENAVAGDLWLSEGRATLCRTRVVGHNMLDLFASPQVPPRRAPPRYDRQARAFGDRGHELLRSQRVGIIGLGGIGSLVCEYLARLGVGSLVLIDPDRLDITNVSRVVGSTDIDAGLQTLRPSLFSRLFVRRPKQAQLKVDIANREAVRANPSVNVVRLATTVVENDAAMSLASCDYIFLAADTMQARLVFNAIVHQYLIPGAQLGTKIPVERDSGSVGRVFSVVRRVTPGHGCLWCNGLITAARLQNEAITPEERRAQRYVEDDDVTAPSVITLNALAASFGVNDYLFGLLGLREESYSDDYVYIEPRSGLVRYDTPRLDVDCTECSSVDVGRFARGDSRPLPTRTKAASNVQNAKSTAKFWRSHGGRD